MIIWYKTTAFHYLFLAVGTDPRNDIGLIKLNWPPIGHENQDNAFNDKRQMRRYQRISYREIISPPICLTYDKMHLIAESAKASVSGTCVLSII